MKNFLIIKVLVFANFILATISANNKKCPEDDGD